MTVCLKRNMLKRYFALFPRYISCLVIFLFLFASIASIGASVFLSPAVAEAQGFVKGILDRHDPLVREAMEVQHRHTWNLMRIPDVVGTGVGIGPDGLPVIKVFTARYGVPGIPEWLESVPVQVEVTGMVIALDDTTARYRPAPIGVSTGHPDITAGTIGVRVKDQDGNVYALSNNHVYANSNNARLGDSALQPGPFDGGEDPGDKFGELYDFEPINFSVFGSNTIDAAIASTTPDDLKCETLSDGYGTPSSQIAAASIGLLVKKYGRTTRMTHGWVSEINVTVAVCYANCSNPFFAQFAWFEDQIGISNIGSYLFSEPGDSGSLIVTEDGNYPLGLLFAGGETKTFANRIDLVLDRFGVTVDDETGPILEPPAAPSDLTAQSISSSHINLAWIDHSDNEGGFKIERCTGDGCDGFEQIATVGANVTSYEDSGLLASTTYTYRVRAYNSVGGSAYSDPASATTLAASALPAAPSDLNARAVRGRQINLSWTDNSSNENGFAIQRCEGFKCFNFAQIATVGTNVASYQDTGLSPRTTYNYRVRAYNAEGDSDYSNVASARTRR